MPRENGVKRLNGWILGKSLRTSPLNLPHSGKVFVMLQAYVDDSGTHDGSHNTVLAGYWGRLHQWKKFESAWRAVLDSEGIEEFHAKEFWPRIPGKGRIGVYRDWSDERHKSFIHRLLAVIESSKIYPFACGVLGAEWERLAPEEKELLSAQEQEALQKPMLMAMNRLMFRVAGYCNPSRIVNFTFDEFNSEKLKVAVMQQFAEVKRILRADNDRVVERIGGLAFEDSKVALPLQAADLLAYEAHRYAKAAQGDKNHPTRVEYTRALRNFRHRDDFWLFDGVRFQHLKMIADAIQRQESGSGAAFVRN
jgi:hypothetical protein